MKLECSGTDQIHRPHAPASTGVVLSALVGIWFTPMPLPAATLYVASLQLEEVGSASAYCGNADIGCNTFDQDSYHDQEALHAPNEATGAASASVTNATALASSTSSWSGTTGSHAFDVVISGFISLSGSATNPGSWWGNNVSASSTANQYYQTISVYTDTPVDFVLDYSASLTSGSTVWGGGDLSPNFRLIARNGSSIVVPLCYFNDAGGACSSLHYAGVLPVGVTTFSLYPEMSGNANAPQGSSAGYDGGATYSLRVQASLVPIPAATWLLGSALGVLFFLRRHRPRRLHVRV